MVLEALYGYSDNLATATTNEKAVLKELATNLANLTTSNAKIPDIVKKLTGENWQLQQQLKILQKNLPQ